MLRKIFIVVCMVAVSLSLRGQEPEVKARVKGLESNEEYMSLLREERMFQLMNDSIQKRVYEFRQAFRNDTVNRAQKAVEILEIEERLFELRDQLGELSNKINIIEQDWILLHLNDNVAEGEISDSLASDSLMAEGPKAEVAIDSSTLVVADTSRAHLIYNHIFEHSIDAEVLAQIRENEELELQLEKDAREYLRNHNRLLDLKNQHSMADSASLATALFEQFVEVQEANLELESRIADSWSKVFDDKTYAYNYLLDNTNNTALRDTFNVRFNEIAARITDSDVPSPVLLNYALQRVALTEYELEMATLFELPKAVDSLSSKLESTNVSGLIGMSHIGQIAERVFLNYEDISTHKTSLYNSRNPIPECEIYPKGTIYRILLGTFSTAQSPTIFRGAAPLYVQNIYGKYRYFAGGFASDSLAFAAQKQCKEMGFRKPEVVVWVDGQYFNLSEALESEESEENSKFRVTFESEEPLSKDAITQIRTEANNSDIIKSGSTYSISNIDGYVNALRLKESIEAIVKVPVRIEELSK